VDLVNLAAG